MILPCAWFRSSVFLVNHLGRGYLVVIREHNTALKIVTSH